MYELTHVGHLKKQWIVVMKTGRGCEQYSTTEYMQMSFLLQVVQ